MKKNSASESGVFNPRIFVAFILCSAGASLAILSFAKAPSNEMKGELTNATATVVPGFHAPVTVSGSSGTGATEPSLAITNPGIRYVSWQVPGEFAKSADGVNFDKITTPDTGAGGDVTNAVGSNGAIYNGQICGLPTELHTCIYRSIDGGATWQKRNMLADNHPGAADRPWIAVLPGVDPDHDTVYLEFHTFSPEDLVYVTKSTDGGLNFGPAIPVETGTNSAIPDSHCNTIPGGVVVDQTNGDVYALWLSGDDVAQNIITGCNYSQIGPFTKAWVSRSMDGGLTWAPALAYQGAYNPTTNVGDNAGKIFSTITQDKGGQIHIGLSVRHNDDPRQFVLDCQLSSSCLENPNPTDMYIVTSPDQGAHWTLPFQVNQTTGSFFFPWIHAGSAGRLDVANYSSTTLRPNDERSIWFVGMSQVTGAVAHYVSGVNATYDSTPVSTPQILLDANRVHGNGTTGGGICTYGLFCTAVPNSNRSLGDVFEVHLDPAGGANVTWTSDNGGNHIGFACQNSGASAFGSAPDLNGCYGPTDMSITKSDAPDPVARGGTLTYHLAVKNNGAPTMPATTSGVTLTDVLPAGVTFISATPSTGTCSGTSTVVCDLGIFPSGATATVDIVVTAPNVFGTLTNTASVAALTSDPNPNNNIATEVTTIGSLALTNVASRKTHGTAGLFDIELPLTGPVGVECRVPGPSNTYTLIYTFNGNVSVPGTATKTDGNLIVGVPVLGPSLNQVSVPLRSVANAQHVVITLNGVQESSGAILNNSIARADFVVGDVTANGTVTTGDLTAVQGQVGGTANQSNFRYDVNANGLITTGDVTTAQGQVGSHLP
jgi:uncharacterized repeat protein (TIGR01451 family)